MSEEEAKRKPGRPAIENASKKINSAAMYLNEAEHAQFMAVVDQSGLSVSNFIRKVCADHIALPQQEEGKVNGS